MALFLFASGFEDAKAFDPPKTEIIFPGAGPGRKVETTRKWVRVGFDFGSVTDGYPVNGVDYFECKLDDAAWKRCPVGGAGFDDVAYTIRATRAWKSHLFQVKATDKAGSTDPTPARWRFRVRRIAPAYAGRTSQGKRITFKVATDGSLVRGLKVRGRMRCRAPGGGTTSTWWLWKSSAADDRRQPTEIKGNSFKQSYGGKSAGGGRFWLKIAGHRNGQGFRGSVRVHHFSAGVRCSSGSVRWTVHPR